MALRGPGGGDLGKGKKMGEEMEREGINREEGEGKMRIGEGE